MADLLTGDFSSDALSRLVSTVGNERRAKREYNRIKSKIIKASRSCEMDDKFDNEIEELQWSLNDFQESGLIFRVSIDPVWRAWFVMCCEELSYTDIDALESRSKLLTEMRPEGNPPSCIEDFDFTVLAIIHNVRMRYIHNAKKLHESYSRVMNLSEEFCTVQRSLDVASSELEDAKAIYNLCSHVRKAQEPQKLLSDDHQYQVDFN